VREDGTQCGFGGCRYSRPADSSNDFDSFSPKLSLRYQLSGSTQLFGGLARGYRAPQATELYRLQRAQEVTDLDSVTADNIEVGITGTTDRGSYTLSFYSLEKDNVIYRDSNFFNVSNGETWHRGVELSFNQKISDVLRVDFAGTYARHTYEHSQITGELDIKGNDMDTAPKVQLNTRSNYDVTRNIQAQIEWQHVASYYTDAENLNEYDGHDLVHARVRFNVNNDITLHARINNVFDTKYAERADFTSFTGPRYFPGRPRNFMLSATFAL
jgi:iron complex outermembrane recepter protein